ncbi:2OG-Fe(II) oxygenase [Jiulongibacter sediminis]|uniref:2OG-Fe(II) oxygenase n=1 Tax=Jiulongibacter sediminis TaxID=1605367 RepID=UPI0026EC4BC0|nr:2OG-Fe(II) oxygenase [Jiulongibacter sediminis]
MGFFSEEQWLQWVDELSDNDYVIIDDFLSETLLERVLTYFREKKTDDDFTKASIGTEGKIVSEIRGDYTYWLDSKVDQEMNDFFELVSETIGVLNRYCYLSLTDFEFHLAYYPPGSFYHRHLDQFQGRSNRMISFIIYLNEGWVEGDGGELKIFKEEGDFLVKPLLNRAILFKSADVPHEVLTTQKGRKSLTGWLLYQPAGLGYLLG